MTAKEYLSRAYRLEKDINALMMEACRIRSTAERATSSFTAERVSGTRQRSNVENAALLLCELEDRVVSQIAELVKVKEDVRQVIARLDKPEYRALLRLRYLCGKKWEEIAVEMNYSYYHVVHRIHPAALLMLEKTL